MIYIASDHAAHIFKAELICFLKEQNIEVNDLGTYTAEKVHYTDYARKLCKQIVGTEDQGILICGTGIGMSIMANRFKGIRAAVCTNEYMAKMARAHNNANVLCLGARVIGDELAKSIIMSFLTTVFDGGRHAIRTNHYDSCAAES